MNRFRLVAAYYAASSAVYGFGRGWAADHKFNRYSHEITPVYYQLEIQKYSEKLARACFNASLYGTFGNPIGLYRLLCRVEIALMGKDPYKHPEMYTEFFDYITLPPPARSVSVKNTC